MSLLIRVARSVDASDVHRVYAPYVETTALTFETCVPAVEEIERRISQIGSVYPWLVAIDNDQLVAYAYASEHRARDAYRWSVDLSVYVDMDRRRRGIGKELYAVLLPLLARQGFQRAHAAITLPNDPSVSLHEKLGFQHIGTFPRVGYKCGAWQDVGWWAIDLQDAERLPIESPAEPSRFDPGWLG